MYNTIIMITLKQVEKDERRAIYVIKTFIQRHPIFSYSLITVAVLIAIMLFSVIMLLGVIGGNEVNIALQRNVCAGEITPGVYNMIMGGLTTTFNIVSTGMTFIVSFIIVFWTYVGFREYLKYKRDNL